jgi:hypothetical protein
MSHSFPYVEFNTVPFELFTPVAGQLIDLGDNTKIYIG